MDLVLFAGPVILRPTFSQVPWKRPTRVVAVQGAGSAWFSNLAEQLRGRDGRILPGLLARYAPGLRPDKVVLAAYSAGHGLLNKLLAVPADRADTDAVILNDATFDSFGSKGKEGYVAYGKDAARSSSKLMVSTTANTSDGSYLTGKESWKLVWDRVQAETGLPAYHVGAEEPMPVPSGGAFRIGKHLYWCDYTDGTHGGQHDLAPATWTAYLVPFLAPSPWKMIAIAAAIAAGGALVASQIMRRAA